MRAEDFLKQALTPDAHQRRGQKLMNELYQIKPDLYHALHADDADPYFDDRRLWAAVQFVRDNWDRVFLDPDQLCKSDDS